jgi:hypothetical protein
MKKFSGNDGPIKVKEKPIHQIPDRIRHYLLDWKDCNLAKYIEKYGEVSLSDLTLEQLNTLFIYATGKDREILNKQWFLSNT